MAVAVDDVQTFRCLFPAGTPIVTPVTVEMQLGVYVPEWVELDVPSGWNGDVGFYLASSNQQVIPARSGANPIWLIYSGVSKHWDLQDQTTSGDWQAVGYNIGNFDHVLTVTWGLTLTADSSPLLLNATPAPLPMDQLTGGS